MKSLWCNFSGLGSMPSTSNEVNPRPTGTPDFPPPTGGGGGAVEHSPSISAAIGRRVKRKKVFKRSSKMITKLCSQFFANVKIVAPRAKK